jgi:hypothetical protein
MVGGIISSRHGHRIGRTHPEAVDRFAIVVYEHLVRRNLGEEEPGVEASRFTQRGDPVVDVMEEREVDHEITLAAEIDDREFSVVDEMAFTRIDLHGSTIGALPQEHPRLLERLADRGDPVCESTALQTELFRGSLVIEATDVLVGTRRSVGLVDSPAGEDVHAGAEDCVRRATKHEHLDTGAVGSTGAVGRTHHIADEHHRRRRMDRHVGRR